MADTPALHVPVLLEEILHWLAPAEGAALVDGTLGGGGHAKALGQRVGPGGSILAMDRDPAAVRRAQQMLPTPPVRSVWANYADLPLVLAELEIPPVDGVLLDLGLSSDQLADDARGFSFQATGPLDLRFDPTEGLPAWEWLGRVAEKELADAIYRFGEERHSRRIARRIVERRDSHPIRTAADLADIVRGCVPRRGDRIDPATRTFQALRIAVNRELESLESVLRELPACVKLGGRVAIISFHSLEDRLVKQAFRQDPRYRELTRKPVVPRAAEQASNPRARSAKLRVAECVICPPAA